MSGGHWEFSHFRMRDMLLEIGSDGQVIMKYPKLSQILRDFGYDLENIIHDLDYDICGDKVIHDPEAFEKQSLEKLGRTLGKTLRVKIYEVEEE